MFVFWFSPYLIPDNFVPTFYPTERTFNSGIPQLSEPNTIQRQNLRLFEQELLKQIQKNCQKLEKKIWSKEQVEILLEMRQQGFNWRQISQHIHGATHQVCKRKYERCISQRAKWPPQLDQKVKYLLEIENRSWQQVYQIVSKKWNIKSKKKFRKLKERYRLYLCQDITNQRWTIEEDISLLNSIKENGKKWIKISNFFKNRSELQVKNRFYGTLVPIYKRVSKSFNLPFETLKQKYKIQ